MHMYLLANEGLTCKSGLRNGGNLTDTCYRESMLYLPLLQRKFLKHNKKGKTHNLRYFIRKAGQYLGK